MTSPCLLHLRTDKPLLACAAIDLLHMHIVLHHGNGKAAGSLHETEWCTQTMQDWLIVPRHLFYDVACTGNHIAYHCKNDSGLTASKGVAA